MVQKGRGPKKGEEVIVHIIRGNAGALGKQRALGGGKSPKLL